MNLKESLRGKLSGEEIGLLQKSFDIIGDVCIIEIPGELKSREKTIVEKILMIHKHVTAIYNKKSEREGTYRLRDLKLLHGKHHVTTHTEHGCRFVLDVRKTYFSPREGTERQRISEHIKAKETVLVMFAGIGPYAIVIGKKCRDVGKVYGIEINKKAVEYFRENVRLNKLQEKVIPILGDVRKECDEMLGRFDHVIMPLPETAHEFLPLAISCLKPKGVVHFYCWAKENEFEKAGDLVKESAKSAGRKAKIIDVHKVLPYKPREWKVCVDAKIS
ncbi:MAG: class I SAM-dependent methyltransferase family protein [Candidatus Aenigmarchaeota archaeon]|nr:class I SAM-dependent methyltransferase family protein [Candidatus Aenigmarchaeota archaeon]